MSPLTRAIWHYEASILNMMPDQYQSLFDNQGPITEVIRLSLDHITTSSFLLQTVLRQDQIRAVHGVKTALRLGLSSHLSLTS